MRTAAIRRAQDFSPENVAKIWGKELARARRRQRALRGEKVDATLLSAKLSKKGLRLRLKVVAGPWGRRPEAMVGWIGRGRDAYGRVRARVKPTSDGCIVEALLTAEQLTAIVGRSVLDLYVFVRGARTWGRARIASAKEQMPPARDGLAPYTTAGGNVSIRREA